MYVCGNLLYTIVLSCLSGVFRTLTPSLFWKTPSSGFFLKCSLVGKGGGGGGGGGGWDIKNPVDSVVPPQEVKDKQLNCFAKLPPHKSIYPR
jgi:hypothetical protein